MSVQLNYLLINWYQELQELFCKSRDEIQNSVQAAPSAIDMYFIIKQFERLQVIWKEMQDASLRMKRRAITTQDFNSSHDCFEKEFIQLQEKIKVLDVQAVRTPKDLKLPHMTSIMYHIFNCHVRNGNITRAREIVMRRRELFGLWRQEALKILSRALIERDRIREARQALQEITDPHEVNALTHLIACREEQQAEEKEGATLT